MSEDPLFPAGSCCSRERKAEPVAGPRRALWLRLIIGQNLKRTLLRALILGTCCAVVFKFALRPAWTDGKSMEPTVLDKRLHFINLLTYRVTDPRRHDIVAIGRHGDQVLFLKRILGLPGEKVEFRNGRLYVNDRYIEEPYVKLSSEWNMPPLRLGPEEYYVAGDNRSMSIKRHVNGAIHSRYFEGTLLF